MLNCDTWTRGLGSVLLRYGLAVLSVVAALFIKELLRTYFDPTPNSLFFCAVVLSSWVGGLGPGLLASSLSVALIDYHFTSPYYTLELNAEDLPRMAVFFLSAVSISWLSASQKRARESLRQARDELELKVQERTAQFQRINEELRAEIAERKNAEGALLSSEAQLKEAQAVAHLGSYEVDVRTGQTRWSDEVFRILGRDPASGSLSRQDFIEHVVHPTTVNMRRNVTMKSSTTGSPTISNVVLFVLMVACASCKAWARRSKARTGPS